jgi:hypothetical protein
MHAQMKSQLYLHFLIEQKKETNEAEDVSQQAIESAAAARQCPKTSEDKEEVTDTAPETMNVEVKLQNLFL